MTTTLTVEQKLKARNAAYKIKFGSPKLRDLLREVRKTITFISYKFNSCFVVSRNAEVASRNPD